MPCRGLSTQRSFVALRTHFVAGILNGARAHPTPDQHHVFVRRIVEAVPAAARRIDHVALARWLVAVVGVNHALALEHDEELVAIVMAMVFMPRARLEHGPADNMIGAGGFLVDEELHLHVDPAVVAFEAFDLGYVAQVGAVHHRRFVPLFPRVGCAFHRLAKRASEFLCRSRHGFPPQLAMAWSAASNVLKRPSISLTHCSQGSTIPFMAT